MIRSSSSSSDLTVDKAAMSADLQARCDELETMLAEKTEQLDARIKATRDARITAAFEFFDLDMNGFLDEAPVSFCIFAQHVINMRIPTCALLVPDLFRTHRKSSLR